ncbi:MAG: radical SAM protein [Bacteroidales bacterium]|nr:radical SAM protein [Bacteroidales bacterium]
MHCEVCPEHFNHPAIDFRVVRNATTVFTPLLNHIEHNTGLPSGVFQLNDSLDAATLPEMDFFVPFPDRNAVAQYRDKYFYIFHNKVALIKTSFGCPYQCSFCFCRIITAGKYHQRSVKEVITELEQIKETEVYIVDDDFLVNAKWLEEFIYEVTQRNIKKHYLVYGRADFIAHNPELMHKLAKTGLRTVIVGFESFYENELDDYNKKCSVEMYKQTMAILHKENLEVYATIIIPPDWDKKDFRHMVKVLKELKIYFINLQPLTPLPKTRISFPEEDIIIDKQNYPQWDLAHISVRPTKLSVPDFYKEILKAYNAILYSPRVLWMYITTYRPSMLLK